MTIGRCFVDKAGGLLRPVLARLHGANQPGSGGGSGASAAVTCPHTGLKPGSEFQKAVVGVLQYPRGRRGLSDPAQPAKRGKRPPERCKGGAAGDELPIRAEDVKAGHGSFAGEAGQDLLVFRRADVQPGYALCAVALPVKADFACAQRASAIVKNG